VYRKALEEVHEFQADNDVTKTSTSKTDYFNLVLQQSSPEYYSPLMSPFSYKLIKKRITMSNYRSNPLKRLLFIMPLTLATLILLISGTSLTQSEKLNQVKNSPDQLTSHTELTLLPVNSIENHILLNSDENDDKTIFISPLKHGTEFKITSAYGMRMHPIKKKEMMHRGIDFKAELYTPVVAIGDGTVRKVELHFENGKGYGRFIIIDHPNGFSSLYAQLNEYKIKEGDKVKKGDVIALVGSSGMSTGPHLHLELKKDGQYVDPALYIK
jgi:murein DD-endopeptidase MepM/ murein hydrolase activator NlpD